MNVKLKEDYGYDACVATDLRWLLVWQRWISNSRSFQMGKRGERVRFGGASG